MKKCFNESFNGPDHQSEKDWEKRISQYIVEYVTDHEGIDQCAMHRSTRCIYEEQII